MKGTGKGECKEIMYSQYRESVQDESMRRKMEGDAEERGIAE